MTDSASKVLALLEKEDKIRIEEVLTVLGLSKESPGGRRAAQRLLKTLIEQGMIVAEGAARARAYRRGPRYPVSRESAALNATTPPPPAASGPFAAIPLSVEAEKALAHLRKPLGERDPVSYRAEFLQSYEPNQSAYLSAEQKRLLMEQGQVLTGVAPAGTYARDILSRILIDLSFNSSRMEGNTYSLLETQRLIEFGEAAPGRGSADAQMILNHKSAIEYLVGGADEVAFDRHTICSLHALLSDGLLGDSLASGRIRQRPAFITGSTYVPLANPHLLADHLETLLTKAERIRDPFEQALFVLIHLSYLQAFDDVNKRTARLAANIPLIKRNLRPLSFVDVDPAAYAQALLAVYETNDISLFRDLFLWAYRRSTLKYTAVQQSLGVPDPLRLKHRSNMKRIIQAVVQEGLVGPRLVERIKKEVSDLGLVEGEGAKLRELIESEILSLHDGNIARYGLRPSEFARWEGLRR